MKQGAKKHAPAAIARGFPPVVSPASRVLVLGSLPGQESLRRRQYYAHPRNAFWAIIERLFEIPAAVAYARRVQMLRRSGVALWDVCAAAVRPGSLDGAIEPASVQPNDIAAFLASHPAIALVCFNGAKAGELFDRHVAASRSVRRLLLPSTSPANATLGFGDKLQRWSVIRPGRAHGNREPH